MGRMIQNVVTQTWLRVKQNRGHSVQINQPTRCNSFTSLLLDVCVGLNMFRTPLHPSSGAYNCTRSLWFYRWSVAVGVGHKKNRGHFVLSFHVSLDCASERPFSHNIMSY